MTESSAAAKKMLTESNSAFVSVTIFDGYYDHWSMLMEDFLRQRKLWELVDEGIPEVTLPATSFAAIVTDKTPEAQRKRETELRQKVEQMKEDDFKVKNFLFQAIHRSIMETILDKSSSKNIWDSMKQKYQGTSRVKRAHRQALKRDFEVLQMKEGEMVDEYIARTLTLVNKLKINGGETMSQVDIVEKILRSLTPKFDYVVCSVEESNDLDSMTLDELQSSLLVHEQRLNRSNVVSREEQALKITNRDGSNRGRGRGFGRGRGRGRGR